MLRIEMLASFESVPVVGEVILLLRKVGQENLITIGDSNFVVLIFVGCFAGGFKNILCALLVARLGIPQRGHFHVRTHIHVIGFHGMHGVGAAVSTHSRQFTHF